MQANLETLCPTTRQQWREWLHRYHATRPGVWLVYHKRQSPSTGIGYAEAVEEALCYGWIDGRAQPVDAHTYRQHFSPRKPRSTWSRINKERVARLQAAGQLAPAGLAALAAARQNGSWALLDEVEALSVPPDLALQASPAARTYFEALSSSTRKQLLHWLLLARRPETRQHRIRELAAGAAQGQLPAHLRRGRA